MRFFWAEVKPASQVYPHSKKYKSQSYDEFIMDGRSPDNKELFRVFVSLRSFSHDQFDGLVVKDISEL
jgi:hypothetical protein